MAIDCFCYKSTHFSSSETCEVGGGGTKCLERDDKDWKARQGFLQLCCMLCIVFL